MTPIERARARRRALVRRNRVVGGVLLLLLGGTALAALATGAMHLSPADVVRAVAGRGPETYRVVVRDIRLPRVAAAVLAGAALGAAGCVMQSLLRNPLASPFTMGVSQGAAFGAAFAIIVLGLGEVNRTDVPVVLANPYAVTLFAFVSSIAGTAFILFLAGMSGFSSRAVILAGIAMGSLFHAGTMLLQYFAEDVKVAAVVFWTFGDIGRAGRHDVGVMAAGVLPVLAYFVAVRWRYALLEGGEETAKSLGVEPRRVRAAGIFAAAGVTAVCVSFLGIIGFVGLVSPHLVRRLVGGDGRYILPFSALCGGVLLLAADTAARTVISPAVLPVGILTSFMGIPLFLYLIVSRGGRG